MNVITLHSAVLIPAISYVLRKPEFEDLSQSGDLDFINHMKSLVQGLTTNSCKTHYEGDLIHCTNFDVMPLKYKKVYCALGTDGLECGPTKKKTYYYYDKIELPINSDYNFSSCFSFKQFNEDDRHMFCADDVRTAEQWIRRLYLAIYCHNSVSFAIINKKSETKSNINIPQKSTQKERWHKYIESLELKEDQKQREAHNIEQKLKEDLTLDKPAEVPEKTDTDITKVQRANTNNLDPVVTIDLGKEEVKSVKVAGVEL